MYAFIATHVLTRIRLCFNSRRSGENRPRTAARSKRRRALKLGRKFRERKMTRKLFLAAAGLAAFGLVEAAHADTNLTIATVNNGDMIRMQRLTDDFSKANPDIKLNWVTLEENVLRQKVTTDIATKGGQYDILTIGTY